MNAQDNTPDIVARAQALIAQIESEIHAGDAYYRSQGLDPDKVREVLGAHMSLQGIEAGQRAFEADLAEAEQYAHEEMARQSFAHTPHTSSRPLPGNLA